VALLITLFASSSGSVTGSRAPPLDPFGQYLAVGITTGIGVTAFLHMAVTMGLAPTTGLTLPFMSYGRSSLMIALLGTGILLSIGRQRGNRRALGRWALGRWEEVSADRPAPQRPSAASSSPAAARGPPHAGPRDR